MSTASVARETVSEFSPFDGGAMSERRSETYCFRCERASWFLPMIEVTFASLALHHRVR